MDKLNIREQLCKQINQTNNILFAVRITFNDGLQYFDFKFGCLSVFVNIFDNLQCYSWVALKLKYN